MRRFTKLQLAINLNRYLGTEARRRLRSNWNVTLFALSAGIDALDAK